MSTRVVDPNPTTRNLAIGVIGNEPSERLKFVEALLGREPRAMTEAEDVSMIKAYEMKVDNGPVILLDVPMLDGRGGLQSTLRSLRSYLENQRSAGRTLPLTGIIYLHPSSELEHPVVSLKEQDLSHLEALCGAGRIVVVTTMNNGAGLRPLDEPQKELRKVIFDPLIRRGGSFSTLEFTGTAESAQVILQETITRILPLSPLETPSEIDTTKQSRDVTHNLKPQGGREILKRESTRRKRKKGESSGSQDLLAGKPAPEAASTPSRSEESLQSVIKRLEGELEYEKRAHGQTQSRLRELEAERAEEKRAAQQEVSRLQSIINEWGANQNKILGDLEEEKRQHKFTNAALGKAESDSESWRNRYQTDTSRLMAQIANLTETHAMAVEELRRHHDSTKAALKEAEKERDLLKESVNSQKVAIEEIERDIQLEG